MTRTERREEHSTDRIADQVRPQAEKAETELWQEVRQTSPEMAMQARIIRVLRPSAGEPRTTYPNTSP